MGRQHRLWATDVPSSNYGRSIDNADHPPRDYTDLVQAVILDHYRNPRNRGEMPPPCAQGSAHNAFCGDTVKVWVLIEGVDLVNISFDGKGCTISQAAASIVTERALGGSVEDLATLREAFSDALARDTPELPPALGDLRALVGVRKFPNRIRCAMLAFEALEDALAGARD